MLNGRTITAIEPQRGASQRLNIFLDGVFAFSLDPVVVEECGLSPGRELSDADVAALAEKDEGEKAYQAALLLLGFRKRSKKEIEDRLTRRGFGGEIVAGVVQRLEEHGLIDDKLFVEFWKDNRETFRPRGKRLMALELRKAGVDSEIIQDGLDGVDESEGAYQAALKKVRSLSGLDYQEFRKKLEAFLSRRGYGWDVIKEAVERVWSENRPKISGLRRITCHAELVSASHEADKHEILK